MSKRSTNKPNRREQKLRAAQFLMSVFLAQCLAKTKTSAYEVFSLGVEKDAATASAKCLQKAKQKVLTLPKQSGEEWNLDDCKTQEVSSAQWFKYIGEIKAEKKQLFLCSKMSQTVKVVTVTPMLNIVLDKKEQTKLVVHPEIELEFRLECELVVAVSKAEAIGLCILDLEAKYPRDGKWMHRINQQIHIPEETLTAITADLLRPIIIPK